MNTEFQYDVFLSHTSADKPRVGRLAEWLREAQHLHQSPADVLDHATSETALSSKLGFNASKKRPGEGFKRSWPPLIKMDESVKGKVERLFHQ